jgi:hypothetical protein
VRFPYLGLPTSKPIHSLAGGNVRYRPILPVQITQPQQLSPVDGCIDCASDDTLFSAHVAARLGINLVQAPQGQVQAPGHAPLPVSYGRVTLLISDGFETCEWEAVVGFVNIALRWALLGQAGFLEFFDVELLGAQRQIILSPNARFPGVHVVHRNRTP